MSDPRPKKRAAPPAVVIPIAVVLALLGLWDIIFRLDWFGLIAVLVAVYFVVQLLLPYPSRKNPESG